MAGLQGKTIKSILVRKINAWAKTIEADNPEVAELVRKHTVVTGGCFVSMLQGEKPNDFDVYFDDPWVTFLVAEYYVGRFNREAQSGHEAVLYAADEFLGWRPVDSDTRARLKENPRRVKVVIKSAGIAVEDGHDKAYAYFELDPTGVQGEAYLDALLPEEVDEKKDKNKPQYRPVYMTSNAISLSDNIQVVVRFAGNPEEIHKNFDFVHCTCYWVSGTGEIVLPAAALESILCKRLHYVGSLYPVSSMIRTRKFIQRGWHINAGQYLKIALQVSQLNMQSYAVLEEQLTGVDCAYFAQILRYLKEKMDADGCDVVDTSYLAALVDKIF